MRKFLSLFILVAMMLAGSTLYAQNSRTFSNGFRSSLSNGDNYSKAQPVTIKAPLSVENTNDEGEPMKLYGMLTQRNSWNDNVAPAAYGMYSFDVVSDPSKLNFQPLFLDARMIATNSGVYIDGKFYLFYAKYNDYSLLESLTLLEFDAEKGNVTKETTVKGASKSDVPYSLAYDPTTAATYGYVQDRDENYMPVDVLVKVNMEDGTVEKIGTLSDTFFGLAFSPTGVLYGISDKGMLKTIDKKTAQSTLIGDTGYQPLFNQSATIDRKSGDMYWAYYGWKVGKLLKVNLADATTTEICSFPDGENIIGLHSRTKAANEGAPGEVTDVNVRFQAPGSMNAVVSCKAPTVRFDGSELSDNMTVKVYINDELAGSADNIAPGTFADIQCTFAEEGFSRVSVSAAIGSEEGPKTTVETFVGIDNPQGVSNAHLDLNSETGEYTLTWDAPGEIGANNGLINVENLTYRVIAYPSCKVIAEDLKERTVSGKVEGNDLNNYFFGIVAKADGKESVEVESNRVIYGDAVRVPFNEDFETDMSWELYTVKDANDDGFSWTLENGRASYQGRQCPNKADDWLFTPQIKMRKDVTYTLYVSFDGGYWQTESFKIIASPGTDLTNPNIEVLYNKTEEFVYQQIAVEYTPKNDGNFYFGFQCYSNANIRGISIDGFSITASALQEAPGDVENIVVTPAAEGKLEATVQFTAPTKTVAGNTLADDVMTSIAIYRDGEFEPIKVFDSPEVGQQYEYVDKEAIHGTNVYKIVSYSEEGNSAGVTGSAWIGEDYADEPNNFSAVINKDEKFVEFNWTKPTKGLHDGYINEAEMTYTLMFIVPELTEDYILIAQNLKETTYVDREATINFLDMKDQYDIIFVVAAVTTAGMGKPASVSGSTGDAYGIPYWESFSNGYLTTAPWTYYVITETNKDSWLLVDDSNSPFGITSYDADNGFAMFYQEQCDAEARLVGPRINLAGTQQPILRLYMFHDITVSKNSNLQIEVRKESDRDTFIKVGEPILVNNGKYGWTGHELPLEEYKEIGEFRVSYHGTAEKGVDFYIDNISINEAGEWDGYPSVSDLKASRDGSNMVHLQWSEPSNESAFEILGYDVYMDGQKINSETITELNYDYQLTDNNAHKFTVRTVCLYGESLESNEAQIGEVGIADGMTDMMIVYSVDGQIILNNCNGEFVNIFSVDGKQIYAAVVDNDAVISAEEGVYIVKAGEHLFKIMVK